MYSTPSSTNKTARKYHSSNKKNEINWNMKIILLLFLSFITGGRIQILANGQAKIIFKWQHFVISFMAASITTFIVVYTTLPFSWKNIDPNDDETIFAPFTTKTTSRFRSYITNQPLNHPSHHPKLYYPRNCPHFKQHYSKSCAKPVPSFIFAGSEFAGASHVFNLLKSHPQVADASVDNSGRQARHVFDTEEFDEANAFESYISQFSFLKHEVLTALEENQKNWIVGENAPHYLYYSHLVAKRIRDNLPHVKLVFFLREPIARAYSQYLYERSEQDSSSKLSFEALIDLELPILRRCGHTSTQTGWEGFVRCHQGSEIRASWKVSNDTDAFNSLAKGMYYPALIPFFQQFPPSQLFIIRTEDILLNPSSSFQKLARFLDIDPDFFSERNLYRDRQLTEDELFNIDAVYEKSNKLLKVKHQQDKEEDNSDSHYFDNSSNSPEQWESTIATTTSSLSAVTVEVANQQQKDSHVLKVQNSDNLLTTAPSLSPFSRASNARYNTATMNNRQLLSDSDMKNLRHHQLTLSIEEPALSTRYRLQRVFRHLNNRLTELFDNNKTGFIGWIYDVDRG